MENALKTSLLVMPMHCIELDCEEMTYITGGEIISLSQLYSDQSLLLANGIFWTADAVAYSAAGGVACSIPFVGWAIAAGLFAIAAACTVTAGLYFAGYSNACNALSTIKHYQETGRSYTIYRYITGGIYSYIVE